jgi:hypothetical protein
MCEAGHGTGGDEAAHDLEPISTGAGSRQGTWTVAVIGTGLTRASAWIAPVQAPIGQHR